MKIVYFDAAKQFVDCDDVTIFDEDIEKFGDVESAFENMTGLSRECIHQTIDFEDQVFKMTPKGYFVSSCMANTDLNLDQMTKIWDGFMASLQFAGAKNFPDAEYYGIALTGDGCELIPLELH